MVKDPLANRNVRIIVQEQNERGEWLDAQVIALRRRGPNNAFSTGAVGYHGNGQLPILGRAGNVNFTFIEAGTKGLGVAQTKEDTGVKGAAASAAALGFYADGEAQTVNAGKPRRIA